MSLRLFEPSQAQLVRVEIARVMRDARGAKSCRQFALEIRQMLGTRWPTSGSIANYESGRAMPLSEVLLAGLILARGQVALDPTILDDHRHAAP